MAKSSFQKKSRNANSVICGTKPSIHNSQLLVSTGIPSLDNILGGGVAVGTVILIEEDTNPIYSNIIFKYFCAESIMCKHHLMLISPEKDPTIILQDLPAAVKAESKSSSNTPSESDMKIAWRYNKLPQVQSDVNSTFGHNYDLTQKMEKDILDECPKTLHCVTSNIFDKSDTSSKNVYDDILSKIRNTVDSNNFSTLTTEIKRNILRIAIQGLGSPLMSDICEVDGEINDKYLIRFLYSLKAIMRRAYGVTLLTVPIHLFQNKTLKKRIEQMCDTVLHIESFCDIDNKKANPIYQEYHGLFNIIKLPCLNSLTCHMPETLDLAFKLKRKMFSIEKLHLPPEISDDTSRSKEEEIDSSKLSCSSKSNSKLDF